MNKHTKQASSLHLSLKKFLKFSIIYVISPILFGASITLAALTLQATSIDSDSTLSIGNTTAATTTIGRANQTLSFPGILTLGTTTPASNALLTIATSSNIFAIFKNGNVAIGTSTSWGSNGLFSVGTLSPTFYIDPSQSPSGAIGIGTTTTSGFELTVGSGAYLDGRVNLVGIQPLLQIQDVGNNTNYIYPKIWDFQVYYGTLRLVEDNTTERLTIAAGGNLGINDTAPGAKLSVVGNAQIGYSSGQTAPSNGLLVSGNVGIGTAQPSSTLHVVGTSTFSGVLQIGSSSSTSRCAQIFVKGTSTQFFIGVDTSTYTLFATSTKPTGSCN